MSNRSLRATTASRSSEPIFTPSSTTASFGAGLQETPFSFAFPSQVALNNETTTMDSNSQPGTPRYTPSSSSALLGLGRDHTTMPSRTSDRTTPETRVLTPSSDGSLASPGNDDPDRPLQSVERVALSTTTPQSIQGESSRNALSDENRPSNASDIPGLAGLRLASPTVPAGSPVPRGTSTPSILVHPSPPPNHSREVRASRTDSLTHAITALHMNSSSRVGSPASQGLGESESPSPARRRRSGSRMGRESHRIEDEIPPEGLFYTREVQEALVNARTLTSRMANVLSSSNLHLEDESRVQGLYQQAQALNAFQLPSTRIVGLVGDSGVGKSSLINSLLDKVELARASSSGTACTCAVTEYVYHDRDDYVIQVDYFPLDELKKQFEELLQAYRDYESLYQNPNRRARDDEEDNDRRRSQRKAELAKETFKASFGHRLEQTPTLLSSMTFAHAIHTMLEWASQLVPHERSRESFDTVDQCSARLRGLTSESDDASRRRSRTCWPFIHKIQVYLNAYILSKGLIIADLPGLRDLNSARKAITERYVRKCHQIFVVARIDRASTDESIKEIFELASRAKLTKVDVICTRSEDIQMREARHDYPRQGGELDEMQDKIDADREEIASLRDDIDDLEEIEDPDQEEERDLLRLQRELRRTEKSLRSHEFELLRFIAQLRNNKVSRSLRDLYRNHSVATALQIFCVSNKVYWEHRENPATEALPYLSFSGILELRRYCIGIVAESRLSAAVSFIKDQIPAFLGSVELWVEAGSGNASAERKQQILDAVSSIECELNRLTSPVSEINGASRALIGDFNRQIYARMRQNSAQWAADAGHASLDWQGWHHSSYKAFCSSYGEHRTNKIGYRCWNGEAMESMQNDMTTVWDSFTVEVNAHIERVDGAVTRAFDRVIRTALSTGDVNAEARAGNDTLSAMRTLGATLGHRKDLVLYEIEKASEKFETDLSSLHTDAFSSIRTAFIGKLLEATYHAANMDYGTGVDRRRKDLITGRFGSRALFDSHRQDCKAKFREISLRLENKIKEILQQQIRVIEADMQMLRDENMVLENERNPDFRNMLAEEVERAKEEAERISCVVQGLV